MPKSAGGFARDTDVVIAGASSGLGRYLALQLARAEARLTLVARTTSRLAEVADMAKHLGSPCVRALTADLTDYSQARWIAARSTRVDVLIVTVALTEHSGDFATADPGHWADVFIGTVMPTVNICRAVLPAMCRRGSGRIITLSGGGGAYARPGYSAYGSAKAAVVRFTETIAAEVAEQGVFANALAQGRLSCGSDMHDERALDTAFRAVQMLGFNKSLRVTGRLVSAVHDHLDALSIADVEALADSDWMTLRRVDHLTLAKAAQWKS